MDAATISRGPFLRMHGGWVEQAEPAGTILLGYCQCYQKLNWTPDGVEVSENISGPRIPLASLSVPREVITCRTFYQHELYAALSSVCANPQNLYDISESIASLALRLAADLPSSLGYSIMAELEFLEVDKDDELFYAFGPPEEEDVDPVPLSLRLTADLPSSSGHSIMADLGFLEVEEDDELFYAFGLSEEENVDLPLDTGTSKRAIEKLISKGGFAADTSDQALDKCSICLEDLLSPDGAKLLQMDCSHLYHQSCVVSWLERRNTCPMCRRKVEQE